MTTTTKRRDSLGITAGTLWGTSWLLMAVAAAMAITCVLLGAPVWTIALGAAILTLSALALLTMTVVTLPRRQAYDWDADLGTLPPIARIPVRVGTWIGAAALFLASLVMLFTSSVTGDVPTANARFAMSLTAILGAVVTLFVSPALSTSLFLAVLCLWGAVVALALGRGIVGLVAGFGTLMSR